MIYIGIDPGQKGGISVIDENKVEVYAFSEPQTVDICQRFGYNNNVKCYVENVHAMPGQGVTSMFNFGKNFGFILGCLAANNIEVVLVSPQKWKKFYGLGHDKQDSVKTCKGIYPDVCLRRTPRCTTDSDGMAEALLIATYGKVAENN